MKIFYLLLIAVFATKAHAIVTPRLIIQGVDLGGNSTQLVTSERGNLALDGFYEASENSNPSSVACLLHERVIAPDETNQVFRPTGVDSSVDSNVHASDVAIRDASGNPFTNVNAMPSRPVDASGNAQTSHLIGSDRALDVDVRHSALPDGASTEATLSGFKTEAHLDSAALLAELTAFASANHIDLTQIDTDLSAFKTANHTDLLGIQTRQDTTNTNLTSFQAANHTDLLGVQTRQDTTNSTLTETNLRVGDETEAVAGADTATSGLNGLTKRLNQHSTTIEGKHDTTNTRLGDLTETAPLSDTASSGLNGRLQRIAQNLTTIDGQINQDFGATSATIRVAAIPGNVSGIADFNAGSTGAQTPRVTSNITRNGTELNYDYGSTSANTLRVASQPGNATGAADFNSGSTGAQTPRTASNIYGVIKTAAPSAGSDGTIQQVTIASLGQLLVQPAEEAYAKWGMMFSASSNSAILTGTTESAFLYFKNPNASGKTARIYRIEIEPTLGNNYVTYRFYRDPTVTVNGTTVTPVGNRDTSQNASVVNLFTGSTVSANGSLFKTEIDSGLSGAGTQTLFNFNLWVEANHSILVTRTLSANATIGGVNVEWMEQ